MLMATKVLGGVIDELCDHPLCSCDRSALQIHSRAADVVL